MMKLYFYVDDVLKLCDAITILKNVFFVVIVQLFETFKFSYFFLLS